MLLEILSKSKPLVLYLAHSTNTNKAILTISWALLMYISTLNLFKYSTRWGKSSFTVVLWKKTRRL